MKVEIIRINGDSEFHEISGENPIIDIHYLIGLERPCLVEFRMPDGRVMLAEADGLLHGRARNDRASTIYAVAWNHDHRDCALAGDVAVVHWDAIHWSDGKLIASTREQEAAHLTFWPLLLAFLVIAVVVAVFLTRAK